MGCRNGQIFVFAYKHLVQWTPTYCVYGKLGITSIPVFVPVLTNVNKGSLAYKITRCSTDRRSLDGDGDMEEVKSVLIDVLECLQSIL